MHISSEWGNVRSNVVPRLSLPCQTGKLERQCVDLRQVQPHVVVTAPLLGRQSEAASYEVVARTAAAEMDHCGQILFLPERGAASPGADRLRDLAIEERRGDLNGMSR